MIKVVAQFQTTLTAGISAAATTGVLESNTSADNDGATIPDGDYGIVIDERNSRREYAIITVSGFNFTFVLRGLSMLDGITEKASNKFAHRKGAEIKIVSHPIIARLVRAFNGEEAFAGVILLPDDRVISTNRQVVDKEYADSIIASGISSLAVSQNGSALEVNINSGYYSLNGVITYYAGASAQALVDDATNYIELTDGVLAINQVGFDNDSMPLGKAICASGVLTSLTDARAVLGWLDIKPSLGIGRDSAGIFVDLATDPALEFSSGKLRTKIKTAGGLVRDANGLSVDTGVTAGKIIVVATGDKLPVIDGSNLTNLPEQLNFIGATASDVLKLSADTERSQFEGLYTKVKEMRMDVKGTVRVKVDMKINGGAGNGRIYINGVAAGTAQTLTTDYQTFSEDFTVLVGDLVQVYIGGSADDTAYAKNFRLYYDLAEVAAGAVITD